MTAEAEGSAGDVLGAVLTGGASRRMGRTKATLDWDGRPMADRVATALAAAGCAPVVLVGGDPTDLASLGRPVLADLHPGDGPVGGVVTALAEARRVGVAAAVVVACDLPGLDADVVRSLRRALDRSPGATVAVARTNRLEPACAIWRTDALDRITAAFDRGTRALHRLVAAEPSVEVAVEAGALRNINTPDDLAR